MQMETLARNMQMILNFSRARFKLIPCLLDLQHVLTYGLAVRYCCLSLFLSSVGHAVLPCKFLCILLLVLPVGYWWFCLSMSFAGLLNLWVGLLGNSCGIRSQFRSVSFKQAPLNHQVDPIHWLPDKACVGVSWQGRARWKLVAFTVYSCLCILLLEDKCEKVCTHCSFILFYLSLKVEPMYNKLVIVSNCMMIMMILLGISSWWANPLLIAGFNMH